MKLTVERTDLAAAMQRLRSVVSTKNVPILSNVLLSASDNRLTIRATNLDLEAIEEIAADITTEGETTVPADMLAEISRNLPLGAMVGMEIVDTRLRVTSGRSKFNLGMLPTTDFPSLWAEDWPVSFSVPADQLAYMIGRVSFSQNTNPTYAYLMGVFTECKDGKLRMVATNRNMLAMHDGPAVPEFTGVTVPSQVVSQMARLVTQAEQVEIGLSNTKIMVRAGNATVTGKLIDPSLKFPPYERIIPKSSPNGAVIDVEQLQAAIRRALVSSGGSKDQTVRFTLAPGSLSVTARNDISDAFDEIEIQYDGPEIAMGFNPQYLLDMLGSVGAETVAVAFGDKKAATVWAGAGDENGMVLVSPQVV